MLTDTSTDFEAPKGARANGLHDRDCPGQPTSHLPREQAIPKQAPSGHPTDSTTQRTLRALDRFSHHITLPRCSDQPATPTTVPDCTHTHTHTHTHTRVPLTRPYVPNRSTSASNALTACTSSRSPRTGWVPGQPGLARPPAPQDHNAEDDIPRPRTPTPQICLTRHPRTSPLHYKENYPQLVPDSPSSQEHT